MKCSIDFIKKIQIECGKAILTIQALNLIDFESIHIRNLRFPIEVSHLKEFGTMHRLEVHEEMMNSIRRNLKNIILNCSAHTKLKEETNDSRW
jgi:hypothetical protein